MGGLGSGRIKTRDRTLIEDCEWLDINEISKYGFILYPAFAFIEADGNKKHLFISHSFNYQSELIPIKERIPLTKTSPNFGGERFWFLCPDCNRRVRKLYRPENKLYFRCRICYDLMYQSHESNVYDGWLRKNQNYIGYK